MYKQISVAITLLNLRLLRLKYMNGTKVSVVAHGPHVMLDQSIFEQ